MMNSTKGKRERVGRMMLMHAINREKLSEAFAGDIIALAGRRDHHRGHPVRSGRDKPVVPGNHDLPQAGDRNRRRAEVQG